MKTQRFLTLCAIFATASSFAASPFMPYVDDLVERSIIKYHPKESAYELDRNLLRQEAIGMALTLSGVDFPVDYACRNLFQDVTQNSPNYWACRIIENAVDK